MQEEFVDEELVDDVLAPVEMTDEELLHLLSEYRSRQTRQHMVGPVISFVMHVLGLLLLSFIIVSKPRPKQVVVEIQTRELEIKDPIKEIEQEIEEVKDLTEDVEQAPATPMPELNAPVQEMAMEDVSDEAPETEDMDAPDMSEVLDIKVNVTPLKISGILGGRRSAGRTGGGAPGAANGAVDGALKWLAFKQNPDGGWPFKAHPNAVQAAATLAFLGRAHTTSSGTYRNVVKKSIYNFIGRTRKDGSLGNHGHATPFVAMAMCDAFAMEPDNSEIEQCARGFVNYAIATQHHDGGWSGGGRSTSKDTREVDIAQTGWWTMALVSAKLGGIEVPNEVFLKIRTMLMQVVDGTYNGKVLFTNHGGRESGFDKMSSRNASIFTMLHFLGVPRNHPMIVKVSKQLANELPPPNKRNYWMLYNMGLGMFQMGDQNPEWQAFSAGALRMIAQQKSRDGNGFAYWTAPGGLYGKGGKGDTGENTNYWGDVGRTAMGTVNLQVFYRYGDIHMLYEQFGGLISEKQLTGSMKPAAEAKEVESKPKDLLQFGSAKMKKNDADDF